MTSHIAGIIGEQDAPKEMVDACLDELFDAAEAEGEAFWLIIGITPNSQESIQHAMDWAIEKEVAFDLVLETSIASNLDDTYTKAADQVAKTKTVEKKVVDRLIEEGAVTLLALAGDDGDSSDEIVAQCSRFFDEGDEYRVLALDDANAEINFGADVEDVSTEEEAEGGEYDFEALGAAADEGDGDALGTLDELAKLNDIDPDEHPTWTALAEALAELAAAADEPEPETKKAPAKKASGGKAPAKSRGGSSKWTEEALDGKTVVELRTIATQSSIDGAKKMGFDDLKAALLGQPMTTAPAEDEPEEETKAAPKTRGKAASSKGKTASTTQDEADLDQALAAAVGDFAQALLAIIKSTIAGE